MKSIFKKFFIVVAPLILLVLLFFYLILPDTFIMPVKGARKKDYDQNAFGAPRVGHKHKGVDIFATTGTPVLSATDGVVVYTGVLSLGGNVVLVMGPNMKSYYYAHLNEIKATRYSYVRQGEVIGTVGKTGNAKNTPAHLHFSISHTLPFKGKFYQDPVPVLNSCFK
jgi:murein DD-endopeptidase MepM/ murein hydrolase activator NlpD